MSRILQDVGSFFLMSLVAMFVENAVLTRGFGVSRLVKLVGDSTVDGLIFFALLSLVQIISAPMAYAVNRALSATEFWFRDYVRPLALVVCAVIAFSLVLLVLSIIRPSNMKEIASVLPMAVFNGAVLGPLLITTTKSYTFIQTMGFALGSGLGYGLAVLVLTEGQRKTSHRNVPSIFKGLPINLIYIGILALAIYGLTGHRVVI